MLERFTWFKQSAYRWDGDGLTLYIDPWEAEGPPADVILITHAHPDHYQPDEIERLRKDGTRIVAPHDIARELSGDVTAVAPGDSDHLPELESVRTNVAFLPIGGFYCMDPDEAAGLARAMAPDLAVPMHYGFVEGVGTPAFADRFARAAAPVPVRTLEPLRPFEQK